MQLLFLIALGPAFWVRERVLERVFPIEKLHHVESLAISYFLGVGIASLIFSVAVMLGLAVGISLMVTIGFCAVLALTTKPLPELKNVKAPSLEEPISASMLRCIVPWLGCLLVLVKVLSPMDTLDWDSLAYHFAVPQWWVRVGSMEYIPFIHQSNFPFLIDNFFTMEAVMGKPTGSITLLFYGLGAAAIYGVTKRLTNSLPAAGIAATAYAGAPLILWSSGGGYIDVGHGLFAGLGMLYVAEAIHGDKDKWWLGALMLGGAAASKYTGLQFLFAAVAMMGFAAFKKPELWKPLVFTGLIALGIGSPWFIRNIANTGNPVYPFFYEVLGARNWDQFRADIYRNEQQTFGVGRTEKGRSPAELPSAVLGLGTVPGRFINPAPDQGQGFPMGAIGVALLIAPLAFLASGRLSPMWRSIFGMVAISLFMWYFLSQQVRYLAALAPLFAVMAGVVAVQWQKIRSVMLGVAGLQAAYSLALIFNVQTAQQLPVLFSQVSAEDYQAARISFYRPAQKINELLKDGGRVALYDEVFGALLTVPYTWANPGHSMLFEYDKMAGGEDFVARMKALGHSHLYFNLTNPEVRAGFLQGGMPEELRARLAADKQVQWIPLIEDAERKGLIERVEMFSTQPDRPPYAILYRIR